MLQHMPNSQELEHTVTHDHWADVNTRKAFVRDVLDPFVRKYCADLAAAQPTVGRMGRCCSAARPLGDGGWRSRRHCPNPPESEGKAGAYALSRLAGVVRRGRRRRQQQAVPAARLQGHRRCGGGGGGGLHSGWGYGGAVPIFSIAGTVESAACVTQTDPAGSPRPLGTPPFG